MTWLKTCFDDTLQLAWCRRAEKKPRGRYFALNVGKLFLSSSCLWIRRCWWRPWTRPGGPLFLVERVQHNSGVSRTLHESRNVLVLNVGDGRGWEGMGMGRDGFLGLSWIVIEWIILSFPNCHHPRWTVAPPRLKWLKWGLLQMGVPQNGWFISWKIAIENGWFGGTPMTWETSK